MKNITIIFAIALCLFSCAKKEDVNPLIKRSFTLVIDEQDNTTVSGGRKICYMSDGNNSKVDTVKVYSFGSHSFSIATNASQSISFFMAGKPHYATKITVLDNISELSFKHVSISKYFAELSYTGSKYSK